MTTLPPDQGGWVGPDGRSQAGTPPPGWWQASDLRWYPPEATPGPAPTPLAPSATPGRAVPPPAGGPVPPQPGMVPPPPVAVKQSGKGCIVALLLTILAVVLLGGCGVVLLAAGGIGLFRSTSSGVVAVPSTAPIPSPSPSPTGRPPGVTVEPEARCTRVDDRAYQLELTNRTSQASSYNFIVTFEDGTGRPVGSAAESILSLQPGQQALETRPVTSSVAGAWQGCQVRALTSDPTPPDPAALAEVTCQLAGADGQGRVKATATAANGGTRAYAYNVTVAYVDPAGIRRGTGVARIRAVQPGATGSDALVTVAPNRDGLACVVVDVRRVPS